MPSRKPSRRKARFSRFGLNQPTDIASKGIAFAVPFRLFAGGLGGAARRVIPPLLAAFVG